MSDPLGLDGVGFCSSPSLSVVPCNTVLVPLLENALKHTGEVKPLLFPSDIVRSLLRMGDIVDSHHIGRINSILDNHREQVIRNLHSSSLNCLICVLLKSNSAAHQERALHMLLDRRDTQANSAADKLQGDALSTSPVSSRLTEDSLIVALYMKLVGNKEDIKCRRLAGKLLLETLEGSNTQHELLLPEGLMSVFLYETDATLRYFAGAVIRFLYVSGANEEILWPQDNTTRRRIFFRSLQMFPKDWIRSFHHYSREDKCDLPGSRSMRSVEDRGKTASEVDNYRSSVYLVQSVVLGTRFYFADQVLATTTSTTLVFIAPDREKNSGSSDIIEVPLQYILHNETGPGETGERKSGWGLHLDAHGVFLVNGKKQDLHGSTFLMDSGHDLTELLVRIKLMREIHSDSATVTERKHMGSTGTQASLDTTQRKCSKAIVALASEDIAMDGAFSVDTDTCDNPGRIPTIVKPRRTSSMVVPLDSGEEVTTKSMQYNRDVLQAGNESASINDNNNGVDSEKTPPGNRVIVGSEGVNEEPGSSAEERRLMDDSSVANSVSSKKLSEEEENDSNSLEKDVGAKRECHGVGGTSQTATPHLEDVHAATPINTTLPDNTHHHRSTTFYQEDIRNSQMDNVTTDLEAISPVVQDCSHQEPSTTSDRATLLRTEMSTRKELTGKEQLSVPKATRSRLLNTQDSLLFPRPRRTKRKVYTAQSKAAVDWDEALRPSDDDGEAQTQNSIDLTSVTSPSSSIASKKINFSGKSKARPRGSSTKKGAARTQKKPNPKKRTTRQNPRNPSPARRKKANKTKRKSVSPQKNKTGQSNATDGVEKTNMGQPGPSGAEDLETTIENNHLQASPHNVSMPAYEGDRLGRHAANSNCSIASPLGAGIETVIEPETTKLTRSNSINSENDFIFLSQIENVAGAFDEHLQNDVDEIDNQLKSNCDVECRRQKQEGRGQSLGSKLKAAFFADDCHHQGTEVDDSIEPNAGTLPDSVNPQENPQVPIESVKRDQCPLASPECLGKRDISGKFQVPLAQSESHIKCQNEDISHNVENPATDITMHNLPSKSQAQNIPDEIAPCLADTSDDRVSDTATFADTMRRKRSPTHDLADEVIPKKIRAVSFTVPEYRGSKHSIETVPTRDRINPETADKNPPELEMQGAQERPSWEVEKERYFNLRKVRSEASEPEYEVDANSSHISSPKEASVALNTPRRPAPKTTVVDVNGSPRPSPKLLDVASLKGSEDESEETGGEKLGRREMSIERDTHVSEHNYNSQSGGYVGGDLFIRRQRDTTVGKSRSFIERLRACVQKVEKDLPVESKNEPLLEPPLHTTAGIPELELKQKVLAEDGSGIQQTSSATNRDSIDLGSDFTGSTTLVEIDDGQGEWKDSLQMVSRNAHDMLINTSKLLMRHLDNEGDSISRVLEAYRKGCHSTLDRLFGAQEERLELHRQQMATIKKHHADLSRDLVQQLEENDRRSQQRLSFAMLTRGLEERNTKLQSQVEDMLNRYNNNNDNSGALSL